ncbi:MAG: PQQ-binding-like beta-propeller repeat protein [Planctomycetes bacterium]|nr:PQQ-binding-like beta-propeller repeat protein [Planctomycetota bacterium]
MFQRDSFRQWRNRLGVLIALALFTTASSSAADAPCATDECWPMFRGDPQLTGVARCSLPKDLAVLWTFETPEPITSTAAIVDGVVYVGSMDEYFYALDLMSGKLKWKYKAKGAVQSSPLVVGSLVVFGDEEGVIHALDRAKGEMRWTFVTDGQVISSANFYDGKILVGSYDGFLYCLAAKDGRLVWKHETDGYLHGSPSVMNGLVVAAGCDERLHVLQVSDGKPEPSVALGSVVGASASLGGSSVFIGTYGGEVLSIDWKAKHVAWRHRDEDKEFPILASAAITDKIVITGGRDKTVRALDRQTGKLLWKFVTKARVESSPVIVGERAFVGSSDGNLYSLSLKTGEKLWHYEAGSPISASPAVAAGCLVVGTEDGLLYCFGSAAEARRPRPSRD